MIRHLHAIPRIRSRPTLWIAAALLVIWPTSVSKIICVSPTGHQSIEDLDAPCCAPGDAAPDTALSEGEPCQGCTDYPITAALEIKCSQRDSSRALGYGDWAGFMADPMPLASAPSIWLTPVRDREVNALTPHPETISLRC